MPTRILSAPFILLAFILLYLTWEVSENYAYWLPAPLVILAALYTLSPQINWWWYSRHPPELEEPLRRILQKHHIYYPRLSVEEKLLFRQRVVLFRMNQDFKPQGWEDVPEDVKGLIAIHAVTLTLGWEEFLTEPYEHVVVYPHAFPSPQFPHHFHHSELFEEDHVLLFNAEPLMGCLLKPSTIFNVALYEYARVARRRRPDKGWPHMQEQDWLALDSICGYTRETVAKAINLPEEAIECLPTAVVAFFNFPVPFQQNLPEHYAAFQATFGFDPGQARRLAPMETSGPLSPA